MAHTPGPLYIHGPSTGNNSPCDDGGDYAILDAENHIIGEAFEVVGIGAEADAKANANLFAIAPDMQTLLIKIRTVLDYDEDSGSWEQEIIDEIDALLGDE